MSRGTRTALFAVAFGYFVVTRGLPRSADLTFVWTLLGLLCASGGSLSARSRQVARDWLPLVGIIFSYDVLRGYADHLLFHAHLRPQLVADKVLGAGVAPTLRLQQALWNPVHPHWWDYLALGVYVTHFVAWILTAAVLWLRNRERFKEFVQQLLILTGLGFLTYVLYPAVPPWLANFQGHLDGVTRIVPGMWNVSGAPAAAAIFENGARFGNDVAAVPSLHAGYACLIALFLWPAAGRPTRLLLGTYVLLMGLALVYLGEHFVIDVLLGWLYAAAAVSLSARLRRRRPLPSLPPLPLLRSLRSPQPVSLVQLEADPAAQ